MEIVRLILVSSGFKRMWKALVTEIASIFGVSLLFNTFPIFVQVCFHIVAILGYECVIHVLILVIPAATVHILVCHVHVIAKSIVPSAIE